MHFYHISPYVPVWQSKNYNFFKERKIIEQDKLNKYAATLDLAKFKSNKNDMIIKIIHQDVDAQNPTKLIKVFSFEILSLELKNNNQSNMYPISVF